MKKSPGRPKLRDKEYWRVYLMLKQREGRARKNKDKSELEEARKLLAALKASTIGVPLPALPGLVRRRTVPPRRNPQPALRSWL